VKEELICELLQELGPYRLMDPDNIHPRVLRELADIIARPFSIVLRSRGDQGMSQKTGRTLMSPTSTRRV